MSAFELKHLIKKVEKSVANCLKVWYINKRRFKKGDEIKRFKKFQKNKKKIDFE